VQELPNRTTKYARRQAVNLEKTDEHFAAAFRPDSRANTDPALRPSITRHVAQDAPAAIIDPDPGPAYISPELTSGLRNE
jgi:hypothetical protein